MRSVRVGVALLLASSVSAACVTIVPGGTLVPGGTVAPVLTARPTAAVTALPGATPGPTGLETTSVPESPGFATPAPATPEPPTPGAEAETIVVVVGSGPDAGTYVGTGDPGCSFGQLDADTWGVGYVNIGAGPGQVSSVRVVDSPDTSDDAGTGRIFSAVVSIGPMMGGSFHQLQWDRFSDDEVEYSIEDNGETAVIHVSGPTMDSPLGGGGVPLDLTVNCPSVTRS
jgi:hypothetical protein